MCVILFGLFIVMSTGCLSLKTRDQIQDVEKVSQQQDLRTQQGQQRPMSLKAEMVEVQTNMRDFNGRLELLERQQKNPLKSSLSQDILTELRSFKTQLNAMSQRITDLEKKLFIATNTSAKSFLYLEGDDFFKKEQWQNAILSYEKYRSKNPDGPHWSEATFKIGRSFEQLELFQEAKAFYQEILDKQPKSSMAHKAQNRIQQLNTQ